MDGWMDGLRLRLLVDGRWYGSGGGDREVGCVGG